MKITFEFEKSTHEVDCMKYSAYVVYRQGRCEFQNMYFGNAEDLKNLLAELRMATMRLEDFLSTIEGSETE
jgi:hypothetical protein